MTPKQRERIAAGNRQSLIVTIVTPLVLFALVFTVIGIRVIDSRENCGFTFGYYGALNRVPYALDRLPGATVMSVGVRKELLFADFWIFVWTPKTSYIQVNFSHWEPAYWLRGKALTRALEKKLTREIPGWDQPSET